MSATPHNSKRDIACICLPLCQECEESVSLPQTFTSQLGFLSAKFRCTHRGAFFHRQSIRYDDFGDRHLRSNISEQLAVMNPTNHIRVRQPVNTYAVAVSTTSNMHENKMPYFWVLVCLSLRSAPGSGFRHSRLPIRHRDQKLCCGFCDHNSIDICTCHGEVRAVHLDGVIGHVNIAVDAVAVRAG